VRGKLLGSSGLGREVGLIKRAGMDEGTQGGEA